MTDPLEDRLRTTSRVFTGPEGQGAERVGGPTAGGLDEVRTRSAGRRRTRRRVRAGVVTAVALVAVAGVARLPRSGGDQNMRLGNDGATSTEATETTVPASIVPAPGTVVPTPGSAVPPGNPGATSPTTVTTGTSLAPDGPTTTQVPLTPVPLGPVSFASDGLGVAAYGEEFAPAMAKLTSVLGPPDVPGTTTPDVRCGHTSSHIVFWGNLAVTFYDRGQGLRLAEFQYGDPIGRQGAGHAAPKGPGRPTLINPWNLHLGGAVPSSSALLAQVQATYPAAQLYTPPGGTEPVITFDYAGTHGAVIELHPTTDGFLFERFTVFSKPDLQC